MGYDTTRSLYHPINNPQTQNYVGTILEASVTKTGYAKYIVLCKSDNALNNSLNEVKKLLFTKIKQPKSIYQENSVVLFHCKFKKIKNIGYPNEFDSEYYWKNKGIYEIGFIHNNSNLKQLKQASPSFLSPVFFRKKLTEILYSALSGQELALANALILGERTLLTEYTTQSFSDTGAMHILAVSGLHIGILLQILLRIFNFFKKWITKNQAIIISLAILWFYSLLTGFSPSVIRSVIMFSFLLIGKMLGKENSEINLLAFSAFLILTWKPIYIFDIGFQLSYSAMLGIYLFYPYLKQVFVSRFKIVQWITEGTMVGIAAQITTIPLTLYYFHQFPNYFIATNIALMAFSFFILLLGILLFSFFWIAPVKLILGFLLQKTMSLMLTIVHFFSQLPFATAKGFSLNKWIVLLLYAIILLWFIALYYKTMKLLIASIILSLLISTHIFYKRFQNNAFSLVYTHNTYPKFKIIKSNTRNYFLFTSKSWNTNKTKRIKKDFNTLYPGKTIMVPFEKIVAN